MSNPLTRDKNDELYLLLVAGDESARRQMIEGNIGLAVSKVDAFIAVFPTAEFLREDMIGEGLLSLTDSVNKMAAAGYVDLANPVGYICANIQHSIGKLVDEELGLQTPARTQKFARMRGHAVCVPTQVAIEPEHLDKPQDPMSMTDLTDLIESCCETDTEREIVALRQESYTDQEIAARLGIPFSTAYVMRRGIYKRFLEKSGMRGEV